ncbi:nucleoside triphosphate pyrophosphohydrolase [Candidatus Babeliales bacterium]|nr:nucleoside triphosphate pyrophosphohydrolase [Candidatus Babeliales bacterium]
MKFKTFKQNKLVRDKIIELMQSNGSKMYWFTLQDKDFIKQLKIKLIEEAQEVLHSNTNNIIDELADVMELVDYLAQLHGINHEQLQQAKNNKREEKGGYEKRIFLTFAEHPKDSPQERYCLADPEKYPEVKL